ncbi:MAG: hypothetical protein RSA64_06695 [Christensenellaceae bacterium]
MSASEKLRFIKGKCGYLAAQDINSFVALSLKKVPKELWGGKVAPHPYRSCGMPAWIPLRGLLAGRGKMK